LRRPGTNRARESRKKEIKKKGRRFSKSNNKCRIIEVLACEKTVARTKNKGGHGKKDTSFFLSIEITRKLDTGKHLQVAAPNAGKMETTNREYCSASL